MSRDFATLLNQGYGLVTDSGWCATNLKVGPAEREEMHRCEMIDAMYDFERRKEKMNRNFKGYE